MNDDEKDQRQQLRQKIKMLEQQIVERTRNYMQSSRQRNKKNLNPNPLSQKNIQTDIQFNQKNTILYNQFYSTLYNKIRQFIVGYLNRLAKQEQSEYNQKGSKNMEDQKIQAHLITDKKNKSKQLLKQNYQAISSILTLLLQIFPNYTEKQRMNNEQMRKLISKFQLQLLQNDKKIIEILQSITIQNPSPSSISLQKLKQKYQKSKSQIKQLQIRCQLITKALNQSQQTNYQLRLQLQQLQTKLRSTQQKNTQTTKIIQNYLTNQSDMKIKIQKLQIMKKQYLKAYSKIKEQKEIIYSRYVDLEQQNKMFKKKYNIFKEHGDMVIQCHSDTMLQTIVQHSQDQIICQIFKKKGTQNTLTAIRQIIQHGLMETNRSTSEKWIKQALFRLQQYQFHQNQQKQKNISSRMNIQGSIHDKYRILLGNVKKMIINDKQLMQDQFNKTVDKIINFSYQSGRDSSTVNGNSIKQGQRTMSKAKIQDRYSSLINSSGDIIESEQQSLSNQEKKQKYDNQINDLTIKLNQSNLRFEQLKKRYQEIVKKKQNQKENPHFIIHAIKYQNDFKNFMDKLSTMEPRPTKQKFNEDFFDKLSQKVFETLCNLPTGQHGQVFFIPTSQEQLEDALEVIYKFSVQYDNVQQTRLNEFKSQALSLTKVLQQIAIANQVSAQMLLKSINNNLNKQNFISGNYVKSLIKKLSQERQQKKSKSMNHIPKQIPEPYQYSTKSQN